MNDLLLPVTRFTRIYSAAVVVGLALLGGTVAGAASINEGVDGDISSDINAPTILNLDLGSNLVTANSGTQGVTGGATNGSDAEFLTVVVGIGLTLDSLSVISRDGVAGVSFIAWNHGASLSGQDIGDIFDGALFDTGIELFAGASASNVDQSLGVDMLGAGSYAFWIQETGGSVDYTLDFHVVPEPGTVLLLGSGLVAMGVRRRIG